MKGSTELTILHRLTQLLLQLAFLLYINNPWLLIGATSQELLQGFTATPDPSVSSFQPLLNDSTGSFSLGFLRVERSQLALAVLHSPSSEPVWLVNTTRSVRWSKSTQLFFNGSLVLSDPYTGVLWSTRTDGDRLLLLNTSNLQVHKLNDARTVLWQSFDFPSDTLMENQNFTAYMSLVSSNGLYSMRLGSDYIGLYAEFRKGSNQIYWKHKAMEAKAEIVQGQGPIYARLSSNGFLGMYQTEAAPVDVQPFDSFQRPVVGIRRLRLETDGNLRGYYWNDSSWVSDFRAITDECELPSSCGSYGLCRSGEGCACLDNRTEYSSGGCYPPESGDFCNETVEEGEEAFLVLRRAGVELPFKELMGFEKMTSLEECESSCERNCSCWGAVFNNASGFCYKVDYPINTLVGVGDESKLGFFKVRRIVAKKREMGFAAGIGLLIGAVVIFVGVAGFGGYRIWRRRKRGLAGFVEDELSPGPYRDLNSASFRSVELCTR